MKQNIIDSPMAFAQLKSTISKLKTSNALLETPHKIEILVEFDEEIKKYPEELFPQKFSFLENEISNSEKITVHTIYNGVLYNKAILKKLIDQAPAVLPQPEPKPQENLHIPLFTQLEKMMELRDTMQARMFSESDKIQTLRYELIEKGFVSQLEAVNRMNSNEKTIMLELSKRETENAVKSIQLEYQNGNAFWQTLLTSAIDVVKEKPKIIMDGVDFFRGLKARPV